MNNQRRKQISKVLDRLPGLEIFIQELLMAVEEIKDDEQEALDNMPENLMGSDRYTAMESAVENLESVYDSLAEIDVDEMISSLEAAAV